MVLNIRSPESCLTRGRLSNGGAEPTRRIVMDEALRLSFDGDVGDNTPDAPDCVGSLPSRFCVLGGEDLIARGWLRPENPA